MSHTTLEEPPPTEASQRGVKSILLYLLILQVANGFVQGYYTPLLPNIANHVNVSVEAMNWFQSSQAMAAAVLVPLLSRLGDLVGSRKVLRWSLVSVFVGTLLIALIPSFPVVLFARVLHGPIGVWLPLAIAIVYLRMSGQSSARAITILTGSLTGGIVLGTIAAGAIYTATSNLVITLLVPAVAILIGAYGVFFGLPKDVDFGTGRIDWIGFAGLGLVMAAAIYTLGHIGYQHLPISFLLLFITGVIFVGWILWEQRVESPAVELSLVASRATGPLYLTAFVIGVLSTDAPPNMAAYMSTDPGEFGYGFSSSSASIALLIAALLTFAMLGAFISSFIVAGIGMRITLVGSALLGALGQLVMVLLPHQLAAFWVSAVLSGFAAGVLSGVLPVLISRGAPEGKTGIANGLYAAFSAVGGAIGGALFKKILGNFQDAAGVTGIGGYMTIWGVCVLLFLFSAVMLTLVPLSGPVEKKTHA